MDWFFNLDTKIIDFVRDNIVNESLDPIMKFITMLGDTGFIWFVITGILLLIKKGRKVGIVSFISLGMTSVIGEFALKFLVQRQRPFNVIEGINLIVEAPTSYSFPSVHAASSFAVACVLLYYWKWKGSPFIVLAAAIAFSRIYLFVHFPTDVMVGAIVGIMTACIAIAFDHAVNIDNILDNIYSKFGKKKNISEEDDEDEDENDYGMENTSHNEEEFNLDFSQEYNEEFRSELSSNLDENYDDFDLDDLDLEFEDDYNQDVNSQNNQNLRTTPSNIINQGQVMVQTGNSQSISTMDMQNSGKVQVQRVPNVNQQNRVQSTKNLVQSQRVNRNVAISNQSVVRNNIQTTNRNKGQANMLQGKSPKLKGINAPQIGKKMNPHRGIKENRKITFEENEEDDFLALYNKKKKEEDFDDFDFQI